VDENVGVVKSDVPRVLSIPRILGGNLPEEADIVGANDAAEVTVDRAEMAGKEPEVARSLRSSIGGGNSSPVRFHVTSLGVPLLPLARAVSISFITTSESAMPLHTSCALADVRPVSAILQFSPGDERVQRVRLDVKMAGLHFFATTWHAWGRKPVGAQKKATGLRNRG
jgi:hypothetical protein